MKNKIKIYKLTIHKLTWVNYFFLSNFRSNIYVEALVPDFSGNHECIETIVNSKLDVFAHNIETVEKLTPFVRDRRARYK